MIADLQPPRTDAGTAPAAKERIHFVGIGGAGMSAVAHLWLEAGHSVSGSDAQDNFVVQHLRAKGAVIAQGHRAQNLAGAVTVVVSSAIREDNPEVIAARQAGLRLLHRSAALAEIAAGRQLIAVAGTNGKTTTTAMITTALRQLGLDPGFSIGGELIQEELTASLGTGSAMVVEADESDGTFVVYQPQVAVITNVQADHLDFYGSEAAVREGFGKFAESIRPGGTLVACWDDPGSRQVAQAHRDTGAAVLTYGVSEGADLRLADYHLKPAGRDGQWGVTFTVITSDGLRHSGFLPQVGRHNLLNAGAAIGVLLALGTVISEIPVSAAVAALAGFRGTKRRFEFRGTRHGVRIYDDYAHNPGKVAAAVATGREVVADGRLVVVFQPHLYSRTRDFACDFGRALSGADEVVVLAVYGAREDPLPGVTGELVATAVGPPCGQVHYVAERSKAAEVVAALVHPGDLLLTIGAGDVTDLAAALASEQGLG